MKQKLSVLRAAVTALTVLTFTAAQGNASMVTNIPEKICGQCFSKEEDANEKNPVYQKKTNRRNYNCTHVKAN